MSVVTPERLFRRPRCGLVIAGLAVSLALAVAVHHFEMSGSEMAPAAMACLALVGAGLALAVAPASLPRSSWARLFRPCAPRPPAAMRYGPSRARDGPAELQVFLI